DRGEPLAPPHRHAALGLVGGDLLDPVARQHHVELLVGPQGGEDLAADAKRRPAVVVLLDRTLERQRDSARVFGGHASRARSWSTISPISSSKLTCGSQPSTERALDGSPTSGTASTPRVNCGSIRTQLVGSIPAWANATSTSSRTVRPTPLATKIRAGAASSSTSVAPATSRSVRPGSSNESGT